LGKRNQLVSLLPLEIIAEFSGKTTESVVAETGHMMKTELYSRVV
jgi:hypothetical protein